jgi:hypothetical protein
MAGDILAQRNAVAQSTRFNNLRGQDACIIYSAEFQPAKNSVKMQF